MKIIFAQHAAIRGRKAVRGVFLLDVAISWGVLLALGVLFLKGYLVVLSNQRAVMVHSITDAFLSQESALGSRVPFNFLQSVDTLYPTYPEIAQSIVVVGRLPGGIPVGGTLTRTKKADPDNLPSAGGSGEVSANPARMEGWELQSFLTYQAHGRQYIKSRTIFRSR